MYRKDPVIQTIADKVISKYNLRAILHLKKAENFKKLAEKRVENTIKQIRLLGALSDTKNYRFNDAQVNKIRNIINREIREMRTKFDGGSDVFL